MNRTPLRNRSTDELHNQLLMNIAFAPKLLEGNSTGSEVSPLDLTTLPHVCELNRSRSIGNRLGGVLVRPISRPDVPSSVAYTKRIAWDEAGWENLLVKPKEKDSHFWPSVNVRADN